MLVTQQAMYYIIRLNSCYMIYLGMTGGGLKHKETYFVTVIAVNKVGLKTAAYSAPLVVDTTPPRVGVCVRACVCTCVRACLRICIQAYMYTCIHVYTYTRVCMYACMHVCMNACMHVCTYARIHVCTYARMHVCMYARVHACMCACICMN